MQDYKIDLNLNDIYQGGILNIPTFVAKNFSFVDLTAKEVMFYLLLESTNSMGKEIEVSADMFGNGASFEINDIMTIKALLQAKKYITCSLRENAQGVYSEFINYSIFIDRFIELYNENTYKAMANKMKHLFEQSLDIEIESIEAEPDLFKIAKLNIPEERLKPILERCKKSKITSISEIYGHLMESY